MFGDLELVLEALVGRLARFGRLSRHQGSISGQSEGVSRYLQLEVFHGESRHVHCQHPRACSPGSVPSVPGPAAFVDLCDST